MRPCKCSHLLDAGPYGKELLVPDDSTKSGYRPPAAGELFKNPSFAKVLRTLGSGGAEAFYTGERVQIGKFFGHRPMFSLRSRQIVVILKSPVCLWMLIMHAYVCG